MKALKDFRYSIIWTIFIFWACTIRKVPFIVEMPSTFIAFDKLAHIVLFGMLTVFLMIDMRRLNISNQLHYFLIILGFPIFLGCSIELIQHYFFYPRHGDILDATADVVGVVLAWAVFSSFRLCLNKYSRKQL